MLYGVHRTRRDGSSFRGTSHVTVKQRFKYTTSVDIQKRAVEASHSFRITCELSESARERRITL